MTRQILYSGKKIQLALDTNTLADGSVFQREWVLHPGAIVILPFVDGDHICLIRQFRAGVGETLWELPAGTLEPPETPEETAIRELAEETGYRAGRWRRLAEFYPSPGVLTERMFLFLAQDLEPGSMQLDRGEQLRPEIVPWTQALAWTLDGTIRDGKTLAGLLLWDRLRKQEHSP